MTALSEAKREVRRLLQSPDLVVDGADALAGLCGLPTQAVLRALLAALCSAQARERHRAAALLGRVTADMAQRDPEAGREIMRRLFWSLNEESGNMAWGAPEALAEIMARHAGLAREFARLLAALADPGLNPLDNPALLGGAIWGLGRLAGGQPEVAQGLDLAAALRPHLSSPDPGLRGPAAWAAGEAGLAESRPALEGLLADGAKAAIYAQGGLGEFTLGQIARRALASLDQKGHGQTPNCRRV